MLVAARRHAASVTTNKLTYACIAVGFSFPLLNAPVAAATFTPATFSVSESGAAALTIPIKVPRGIGGMEPELKLSYTSDGGNGLLGMGWYLSGPSAITRCPRSILFDAVRANVSFSSTDRFCLDGQRLLKIDPTNPNAPFSTSSQSDYSNTSGAVEYRTERDSFSRIRIAGGAYTPAGSGAQTFVPNGFTVETKSGLIYEYGRPSGQGDASAQVTTNYVSSVVRTPTIARWNLHRITDRLGNAVEFYYCAGRVEPSAAQPVAASASSCNGSIQGAAPLHYIRYTSRAGAPGIFGIVFRYEDRPDAHVAFLLGTYARQTQRMSAIQTFVGFGGPGSPGAMVRTYDIAYRPMRQGTSALKSTTISQLVSVRERGADDQALPPVTFTYPSDVVMGQALLHSAVPDAAPSPPPPPPSCGPSPCQQP